MDLINQINETIGKVVSWLSVLLVFVIVVDVLLRYTFNLTSAASFELEWHLFACIFLLGAAYTLKHDRHVRVDVFYHRFTTRQKAWINLLGTIFFLLPLCGVALWESVSFVQQAYAINETSPQPGGLPARWVIKSTIPVGFLMLGLQGISIIFQALKTIRNG